MYTVRQTHWSTESFEFTSKLCEDKKYTNAVVLTNLTIACAYQNEKIGNEMELGHQQQLQALREGVT